MTFKLAAILVPTLVAALTVAPMTPASAAVMPAEAATPAASVTASVAAAPTAGASTPVLAVKAAAARAATRGVTEYLSVVDRSTGTVLAETANAHRQVASESIMKLFLAAYYLLLYGGYSSTPQSVKDRLSYMLRYSDDATASALFTSSAIPTIAARYGLTSTTNATDRAGHWGAARITAHDMTHFLYRAAHDSKVGPWLIPVMAKTRVYGSDGFNQDFGLNALSGPHGSKQGWGGDSFWTAKTEAIHSVGYTAKYFVAVLQLSDSYPDPARSTATSTATSIQAAIATPPNGSFVKLNGTPAVYRMVGGAPVRVYSWKKVGGKRPVIMLDAATWKSLRKYPADGRFVKAAGLVYVIAGGAPLRVGPWSAVGGPHPFVTIDPTAITRAGNGGSWNHLRQRPANGTYLKADGLVYLVAGGAPVRVGPWSAVGGPHPFVTIDPAAISRSGTGVTWNHLRQYPLNGTYVRAKGVTYRIAGGAPLRVSDWSTVGGKHASVKLDPAAITRAGSGVTWNHLRRRPTDGTYIRAAGIVYRIAGGAPLVITNWKPLGGARPATVVDPAAITHAGQTGAWSHLRWYPATGTFLRGMPGQALYRVSARKTAVLVPSWKPYGGPRPTVRIDQTTIDRAGTGRPYNHLKG